MKNPANPANNMYGTQVWKAKLEQKQSNAVTELLTEAGILKTEELCEIAEIAESLKQSTDAVVLSSYLSKELTEEVKKAQIFMQKNLVSMQLAAQGLAVANRKGISFEDGLSYFGWGW